jgi:hypothetical protein
MRTTGSTSTADIVSNSHSRTPHQVEQCNKDRETVDGISALAPADICEDGTGDCRRTGNDGLTGSAHG